MKKKISRQYAYQLRHRSEGKCESCTKPRVTKNHCRYHADLRNVRAIAYYHRKEKRVGKYDYYAKSLPWVLVQFPEKLDKNESPWIAGWFSTKARAKAYMKRLTNKTPYKIYKEEP